MEKLSDELFNAVLSMDSYNRGYDESIMLQKNNTNSSPHRVE